MKHKHCELIHAFADGAAIERFYALPGKWILEKDPEWSSRDHFRIKPNELEQAARDVPYMKIPGGELNIRFFRGRSSWTCKLSDEMMEHVVASSKLTYSKLEWEK